ncbi:MAG TPA: tetratricopeptide repeat protein, partial [Desulfurivibrionaceae bacterium]|nr:tetratricopeptide repeat protein [Desulfurivibrionaceae bacterium]
MAAIEMAKSNEDLALAAEEFRLATEIAPQMAIAWFNLGKAQTQLGRYKEAIDSYRRYLTLAPQAKDAQSVRDEIVKLEFRQELAAKAQARVGIWVGQDGSFYRLTFNGNRLTLKTDARWVPEDEARFSYSLVGGLSVG